MKSISNIWLAARRKTRDLARDLAQDRNGIAATEFAIIVPIMLVMFFGTVEFSSAVAVDRKVTLVARTLSDLTSQALSNVTSANLQNVFTASIAITTPYPATPTKAQISEIYVSSTKVATVQWSQGATIGSAATQATLASSTRNAGDIVTTVIPPALLVPKTYLILSEVSYLYTPTIGYVMAKGGVNLSDVAYTRPRQSACITYNSLPVTNPPCSTP
jgi:Flp pilus assembly protein TadG